MLDITVYTHETRYRAGLASNMSERHSSKRSVAYWSVMCMGSAKFNSLSLPPDTSAGTHFHVRKMLPEIK